MSSDTVSSKPKRRLSLSSWIFISMGAGLAAGLFFGELVGWMNVVGDIWIKLLQMTVLPYVMLSLIAGLGRLDYDSALELAKKGGAVLLLLWAITIAVVFVFSFVFPEWPSSSFYSEVTAASQAEVDFVKLYIPSNPFHALANNLVPAVVLFSIAVGVALIGIKEKAGMLQGMELILNTLNRINGFIVWLTPIGVFAIVASASGTLSFAEFEQLEVYIYAYICVSLVMALWVLPALVTTLTPLSYRDVVGTTKDALITAFATTSLFVVLPILMDKSKELIARYAENRKEADSAVEVLVPASFNFPHAGKLLTLTFVLFAGWYAGHPIGLDEFPKLVGIGVASLFANVNLAIPFILDKMQLPQDLYQLFLTTGVVNARFATLLAAMFTLTFTLLGAFYMCGLISIRPASLIRYLLITILLLGTTVVGVRSLTTYLLENAYDKNEVIGGMRFLNHRELSSMERQVHQFLAENPPKISENSRLQDIANRGVLRVCYESDDIPFSYINTEGELVGLDIELFHYLARDLKSSIEFVPSTWTGIFELLNYGYCDIGTGRTLTPSNTLIGAYTIPVMNRSVAFLVKDHERSNFATFEDIREIGKLKIAIAPNRYYGELLSKRLPAASLIEVDSLEPLIVSGSSEFDAVVTTGEKAAAWSLLYPEYTAVVPVPNPIRIPAGYPLPHHEADLADYLKIWLEIKKQDGTFQHLYDHWVLGKEADSEQHRWSVIRDVLHWVDP